MIITITGPSGSGKTTLLKALTKYYPNYIFPIVSTTTRPPRPREIDGVDYYFVSEEDFKIPSMFEYVLFAGNYYGVTNKEMEIAQQRSNNAAAVIILDPQGVSIYKKAISDTIYSVYIDIDADKAEAHLKRRDGKKKASSRIRTDLDKGLYEKDGYDCVIKNDGTIKELCENFMNFFTAMRYIEKMKTA